jgi:uncharacterized membrane protein YoaK (UPF0700 family)
MAEPGEGRAPVAPFTGPLLLVAGLAAVTGCLDAVSLARLTRTFVGFQTGNTVLVGLGLGRGHFATAAGPSVAVVAFLIGTACTPTILRPGAPAPETAARRLLAMAAALLVVNAVVVLAGAGPDGAPPTGVVRYVSIVISAWAMACQTSVVRRVHGVSVSSTFSTGMLTRLGHSLGSRRDPAWRSHERVVTRVLGVSILSFVAGALVGGLLLVAVGNAAVIAPAAGVVLVLATVGARRVRPGGG